MSADLDEVPTLLDLVLGDDHDQQWRRHAACVGTPSEWWFPPKGSLATEARKICASCPVIVDCLVDSVYPTIEQNGIRAGAGEPTRRYLGQFRGTHPGFIEGCDCAFCVAVTDHVAGLRRGRLRRDGAPMRSFGRRARHNAATWGRGCRCEACTEAKVAVERRRLRVSASEATSNG